MQKNNVAADLMSANLIKENSICNNHQVGPLHSDVTYIALL